MVSGLVTSPWDQDRIFSGLARRILMASKSGSVRPKSTFGRIGIIRLIATSVLGLDQLDVQAEALQLSDQDVERLRHAGGVERVALDDRLVDLGPPVHVV